MGFALMAVLLFLFISYSVLWFTYLGGSIIFKEKKRWKVELQNQLQLQDAESKMEVSSLDQTTTLNGNVNSDSESVSDKLDCSACRRITKILSKISTTMTYCVRSVFDFLDVPYFEVFGSGAREWVFRMGTASDGSLDLEVNRRLQKSAEKRAVRELTRAKESQNTWLQAIRFGVGGFRDRRGRLRLSLDQTTARWCKNLQLELMDLVTH